MPDVISMWWQRDRPETVGCIIAESGCPGFSSAFGVKRLNAPTTRDGLQDTPPHRARRGTRRCYGSALGTSATTERLIPFGDERSSESFAAEERRAVLKRCRRGQSVTARWSPNLAPHTRPDDTVPTCLSAGKA